ncbi:hypothetical protein ACFL9S_11990 [Erwinia sp. AnSW2-5]|uniref:hypothetical protein n=1 Tax=Erwinia sp. AnSW2-5 TaxID=3367692 RepID=UPI00385CF085
MKATDKTVNDVMLWLNQNWGLSLPVLPLTAWAKTVVTLWQKIVSGVPESGPLPQSIEIEGDWQPLAGSRFTLTHIRIDIRDSDKTGSKPLVHKRKA